MQRKMHVQALSERKLKRRGKASFGCVVGRTAGVECEQGREQVALLVSQEISKCMVEWKEVSSRMMWAKMKIGYETWVIFLCVRSKY